MTFSYIKDIGLKPNGSYTKRSRTDRILVHHFGGNSLTKNVHEYHISLDHKGIDYNVVVERDGRIVYGRGLEFVGGSVSNSYSKTKGMNATSVAIALQGDYEKGPIPDAQWASLCRLTRDLVQYYRLNGTMSVLGHNEAAGMNYTDCPGRYIDMSALRNYAFGAVASMDEVHTIVSPPSPAVPDIKPSDFKNHISKLTSPFMRGEHEKWVQHRLNRHNVDPGGVDGIFGPKTEAGVKLFQAARIKEGRDIGASAPDGKVGYKTASILAE